MIKNMSASFRSSPQAGFSLTELLVVIAIISVLTALMVPNLLAARQRAASKEMQQFGNTVTLSVGGFLTSRPGLTAQTLLDLIPESATAPGNYGSGKNCATGGTFTGSAESPSYTATGGDAASGTSWPQAPEEGGCIITTDVGSNEYAIRVITWSNKLPEQVYVNGRKP